MTLGGPLRKKLLKGKELKRVYTTVRNVSVNDDNDNDDDDDDDDDDDNDDDDDDDSKNLY